MKRITYEVDIKTQKAQRNVKNLNKEIKTTNKEVKDTGQSMQGITGIADKFTGGAISKFKNLKGSIGGVTAGFKTMRLALISTGIGALVVLIGSLVAAFSATEAGQDKFTRLTAGIGVVVNNLVDILATLGETLISAFEKPQKAWEDFIEALDTGYEFVKKQFIDRLSSSWTIMSGGIQKGLLNMRIAWLDFTGEAGEADKFRDELKLIQDDMNEASDILVERNKEIAKVIVDAYDDAKKATKEFLDEQEREIRIQNQISDARAKANKIERALVVERAEADRDIAALRDIAAQKDKFNLAQRKAALIEAAEINEKIASDEIEVATIRRDAILEENKLSKSNKADLDKAAEATAKVIRLETQKLNLQKRLNTELATINAQAAAESEAAAKKKQDDLDKAEKKAAEAKAKAEKERLAALKKEQDELNKQIKREDEQYNLLQQIRNNAQEQELFKLAQSYDKKFELANGNFELEKALTEQQALDIAAINDKYRKKEEDAEEAAIAKAKEQRRNDIDSALASSSEILGAVESLAEQSQQKFADLNQAVLDNDNLSDKEKQKLLDKNNKRAKKAFDTAKGAQIASALINTYSAAAAALAPPPIGAGPIFGPIAAAAALISGFAQVNQIRRQKFEATTLGSSGGGAASSGAGGGGASQQQAPQFNVVGQSGFNQIAGAIGNQGPTQAYVVAGQVTTQQQLNNAIINRATF